MNLDDLSDEDYFAHLKEMFKTPGWDIFIQELTEQSTTINSVEDTDTVDQLFFRKGQLAVIGNILNTELSIARAEADADEDTE